MSIRKLLKARRRLENKLEHLTYVRQIEEERKAASVNVAQCSTATDPDATLGRFSRVCATHNGLKMTYHVQESHDGQNWFTTSREVVVGGRQCGKTSMIQRLKNFFGI